MNQSTESSSTDQGYTAASTSSVIGSSSSMFAASASTAGMSLLSGSSSSLLPGGDKPSLLAAARSSSSGVANGSKGNSSENLPPRCLARVARDIRNLVKNPPDGVRLVLDEDTGMPGSLSEILAEIEGPEQTPYHTKIFQLKLVISMEFPAAPPRGYFLTKIYHPNVDPSSGAICVNTLKKDWTPTTSLSHVLTVIRCLMIVPFPESSLNDEAGKHFMESYDEYARRAKLLAGVHGLDTWTSGTPMDTSSDVSDNISANLKSEEEDKDVGDAKKMQNNNPNASLTNPAKLGKMGSRSNIPAKVGKDKKLAKKKSLRRL